ncbi:autophagy-related protein 9 [Musa acuminata AAA Group]|uniref:autophagy-related protein 9 n=1 Tax=Musa acuminata AAA Group TaxID=214697 RepID=UPI0031DBCCAA
MFSRHVLSRFEWPWRSKSPLTTQLLDDRPTDVELSVYSKLPGPDPDSPSGLLNGEELNTEPIVDLDLFFGSLYNYYCEKGLRCITLKWIVEILSVIFVECFIWFFLLVVDWPALRNARCGMDALESGNKPCDLAKEAINKHPLVPFTFTKGVIVGSMIILAIYGVFNFLKFIVQFKSTLKVRDFYYNSLNVTDRDIQTTSWPVMLEKVIKLQRSQQLCVIRNLTAHDIVMRMMRKENYLIGMLNKRVLAFPIHCWIPGAGPVFIKNGRKYHMILPKTLEWTLNWCIFQSMFDSKFCIRREFLENPSLLRKRLKIVGIGMFLISPCLVIFMLVYLFLRHAEQFYHHPSTASSRRWSNLSKWIFREFNEVEHLFRYRMSNSIVHASNYLKQFPAPLVTIVAKFISFVSGGFAAILIIIAFMDESLLEGHVFGRNLFWYAAIFGSVTAISRAAVADELQVLDHEGAMSLVVDHTHYMPKKWRGKENSDLVRSEFETLFQYTGMMLLEEMMSIFLTPIMLIFVVPERVDDILRFISDYTVYVDGVGHICSFSAFDFKSHGNGQYGSPYDAARERRSSQGKMEKSFFSFQCTYPTWEPSDDGRQFLSTLQNFKEKQIHQGRLQDNSHTWTWQALRGLRVRHEIIHRFPSGNVFSGNGGFPRYDHHPGSVWLTNHEQRNHPYILDWYYTSKPLEDPENPEDSPLPEKEMAFESIQDFHATQSNLQTEVKNTDQSWDLPFSDRLQSHIEASTSGSLFKNSAPQDLDRHIMHHRWWDRTALTASAAQASFLEPPSFGHHDYSHHSDDVHGGGSEYLGNLQRLSETSDVGEADDEVLDLPFVDSYVGSLKNLTVRIPRMSDDRIH